MFFRYCTRLTQYEMIDMRAGDEYFVLTTSARQCRVTERVDPFRDSYVALTSCSYAKPAIEECYAGGREDAEEVPIPIMPKDAREVPIPGAPKDDGEVPIPRMLEDVGEAPIPRAPVNPMFFTSFATHVAMVIW